MFSQLGLILMGLFLVVEGIKDGDYLHLGIGLLVAVLAASTLYKLKTGK